MDITAPNYYLQRVINLEDVLVYKEPSTELKLELDTYGEYNSNIKLPKITLSNLIDDKMRYFQTNLKKVFLKGSGSLMYNNNKVIVATRPGYMMVIESWANSCAICEYDMNNKRTINNKFADVSMPKEVLMEIRISRLPDGAWVYVDIYNSVTG